MTDIAAALEKYNLSHKNKLTPEGIKRMLSGALSESTGGDVITPCPHTDADAVPASVRALGLELIAGGRTAAVTMAGGQGTRLGYSGPKGCFDIGVGMSLFELQARRIAALSPALPWYIMTSEENHGATEAFFAEHAFFGLKNVSFFTQGMLPSVTPDGIPLLSGPDTLALSPDGNGGVFAALLEKGVLDDMRARGVEFVFFCGIDNALARVCDPLFLGFAKASGLEGASKSVLKTDPEEKAGAFCLRNGKPGIIEYSELPPELRYARDASGALCYGDANIVAHIITLSALRRICGQGLPLHAAYKKVPYFDGSGKVEPASPNACKLEAFIFDAFSRLDGMAVMRVEREREFAPVKNLTGADSPETAMALIGRLGSII